MLLRRILPLLAVTLAVPVPTGESNPPSDEDGKHARTLQKELAKKDGDAIALAADLLADNAAYRRKNADLKAEADALKAKVPSEGTVVLTGSDAKLWDAYKAAGTPEQIAATAKERDELKVKTSLLETENASTKRETLLSRVADAAGFKHSVLVDQDARTPGLTYELKEVEVDGKKVERAFVRFKDGEGDSAPVKELTLDEFAALKWGDYLPSLKKDAQSGQAGNGQTASGTGGQGTSGKTRTVAQGSVAGSAQGNYFDKLRAEQAEKAKAAPVSSGPSLEERLNMRPKPSAA